LITAALCQAQDICPPPTSATIVPDTWYSGVVNNVTITTPDFNIDNIGVYCASVDLITGNGAEVPVTSWNNLSGGPGWEGIGVEPAASVPTEAAFLVLEFFCDPEDGDTPCPPGTGANGLVWRVTYPVQIVNCPNPKIDSVSPSTWFAGKTYGNVKIIGTGFTTAEKATASCPETTVTIAAADGNTVPVSGVTVVDKTKITLTVKPDASGPTQGAVITVGTAPNIAQFNAAQILGNQMKCGGTSMQCNGNVISVTDGSTPTPQDAIVGQPINLTTPALPTGVTATSTTWTVGGPNIGGYMVASNVSSATVTPTELKTHSLNAYWVYQGQGIPVTYKYCVNIPGVGNQCSPKATAAFNVSGPTASIGTASLGWSVTAPFLGCHSLQFLVFGLLFPNSTSCTTTPFVPGIAFSATNVSSVPEGGGQFSWVQLVRKDVLSGVEPGVTVKPLIGEVGLDNTYPYNWDAPGATQVGDTPAVALQNTLAVETRDFKAKMYLMWTSNVDPSSIPVPVGYVTWRIYGTAARKNQYWGFASSGPTTATYQASTDIGPPSYGLPTWTTLVTNTNGTTSGSEQQTGESETVLGDGEEENKE
jgi:hypothetical protein